MASVQELQHVRAAGSAGRITYNHRGTSMQRFYNSFSYVYTQQFVVEHVSEYEEVS
jgi:diaminopimelate decarboxylase